MSDILKTKFLLLKRNPGSFIVITIVTCVFAYVLGLGQQAKQPIAIFSSLQHQETDFILKELEELTNYQFTVYSQLEATEKVKDGKVDVAISLHEQGFDLIVSPDFIDGPILQNELNRIYYESMQEQIIVNAFPEGQKQLVSTVIDEAKINPSFEIEYVNFTNEEEFVYDPKLHSLFGFTLFMVIYTVANGVFHIVMERRNHIWDRLTVSSVKKTEIYLANLAYSFLLGYLQVLLILCIFHFGVGVDFYGGFYKTLVVIIPYLLCIVAFSIFMASIAGTPGKFNTYIAVFAVPFAMLGGAYWPLEIVTSEVIIALSYISPITYGLELLKGVTINSNTISQIIQPLGVLLFMTVIFMGIGINILEKRQQA